MKSRFVDLYEARISLSGKDGLYVSKRKYHTKFTGTNYLPVPSNTINDDLEYNNLYHRVPANGILKLEKGMCAYPSLSRSIYYLEGQEDQAIKLLKDNIEEILPKMLDDLQKMIDAWKNRK